MAALNCSETGRLFRARIGVTDFISTSFPDAEFTTVRWFRMVAFPLDDRNARTTGSRTLAPRAPLAPSAVDLTRFVHNWHAFLVLTPLRQNSRTLSKISLMAGWLIYSSITACLSIFLERYEYPEDQWTSIVKGESVVLETALFSFLFLLLPVNIMFLIVTTLYLTTLFSIVSSRIRNDTTINDERLIQSYKFVADCYSLAATIA